MTQHIEIRTITKEEWEVIEEYLFLDEELLYSFIPQYISSKPGVLTGFATQGQIRAGKLKFDELQPFLHKKLCEEWKLCEKIDNPALQDNLNLVVTLSDVIILTANAITIPSILIASLVVKKGVQKFCDYVNKQP